MRIGAPELVLVIFVVTIVLCVIAILRLVKRKSAQKDALEAKRLEVMNALLQKFQNSSDLVEFLNTDAGKRMTEAINAAPSNALTRSIVLVILAAVCFWYGLKMIIAPLALFGLTGSLNHPQLIWGIGLLGLVLVALAAYIAWISKIWKQ
jgi:hypothetical protein